MLHRRRYPLSQALRTLLSGMARADRAGLAVVLVLAVVTAVSGPLIGLWLKLLLDGALSDDGGRVAIAAAALAVTVATTRVLGRVQFLRMITLQERVSADLDRDMMAAAGGVTDLSLHETPEYADEMEVLRQQRGLLAWAPLSLLSFLQIIVGGLTMLVLLASVDPILVLFPLAAVATLWTSARAERHHQGAVRETAELSRRALHLYDSAAGAPTLRELHLYGAGPSVLRLHADVWARIQRRRDAANVRAAAVETVGWLAFAACFGAVVLSAAWRAVHAQSTVGDVLLVLTLVLQLNGQVNGAVWTFKELSGVLSVVDRFLWLRDRATPARANGSAAAVSRAGSARVPERITEGLVLDHLSFRYPGASRDALRDVNLTIPAGSRVAVVGENGAGKTTLVKLLCRYHQPTTGRILVDGVDLSALDPAEWRARVAGAFQDFARFEFLARHTVGVGDLPARDDADRVAAALRRSLADDVIAELPDGLDTRLGTSYDDGTDLSGGQWQRLALGRAMMRTVPLMLVLDEPTASLDARTEHDLFAGYARSSAAAAEFGGITLFVSHRFSTVRMADLIVVLDGATVAEVGTHDQLMASGGIYSRTYRMQADAYR